ncbi:uncharacterized protein UTRI_01099_B [Ustilago trichophora]|uniref:DUF676 domain-containing protein n=1 Tax=Ustilago trichophora TaxID=86804 RepID=A0A5C3DTE4_9BASI|nr:uncharacterized protein UTRI_01099_B [Ustilago trichophora]
MSHFTHTDELNPCAADASRAPSSTSTAHAAQPGSSRNNAIVMDHPPQDAPPAYSVSPQQRFPQPLATPPPSSSSTNVNSTGMEGRDQLLLLVFIHGFKGSSDTTFEDFPSRLTYNLQETYPGLHVKSLVYPTYDTRGSLAAAVESFVEWLIEHTVMLESKPEIDPTTGDIVPNSGKGGGMGSVKIVLAGHSMGGLVAVDAALAIAHSSAEQHATTPKNKQSHLKLWPRVVGVLAYDTPYYGVHPGVFKNGINKYAGYLQTAQSIGTFLAPMGVGLAARWNSERQSQAPSSSESSSNGNGNNTRDAGISRGNDPAASTRATSNWRTALMATGAVALASGAAASAAYFNKDKLNGAYGWVTDHLAFVSNLWDDNALRARLDRLVDQPQILFHCYYTRLPSSSRAANPQHQAARDRTFIILPPRTARCAGSFTAMDNPKATDEVDAHISMFSPKNNPRYFDLGLKTSGLIAICLDNETRFGDQVKAQEQSEERGRNGGLEEEKGLRDGDDELEWLKKQAKNESS